MGRQRGEGELQKREFLLLFVVELLLGFKLKAPLCKALYIHI